MRTLLPCLLLVVGCGAPAAESPETPRAENAARATAGAESPEPLVVELDRPGEGERLPLRYRFEVGVVERGRARMTIATRTSLGGTEMPSAAMPPMVMDFTLETTERAAGGVRYRYTIDRVELETAGAEPAVARQIQAAIAPLARLRGDAVVDERGRVLDSRVEVPPDMPPELASTVQSMNDMLRQMVAPLPDAPVAVGAEWKTETVLSTSGVRVRQRTFYRLVSREGDRVALDVRLEQSGIPGPIESPDPSVAIALVELTGSARGTTTLRLDRMVPERGEVSAEMSQDATITAEGETVPMHVEMQMEIANETR